MKPESFTQYFKSFFSKTPVFFLLLLMPSLFSTTACDSDPKVDASFGYAFIGTGAVMVVALVIATFVTRRSGKRKRDGER